MLGFTADNAATLREWLLQAALSEEATPTEQDAFGQRYVIDVQVQGPLGMAFVRSAWIVRADEDFPRLTSCYVR